MSIRSEVLAIVLQTSVEFRNTAGPCPAGHRLASNVGGARGLRISNRLTRYANNGLPRASA
jgi:hypothetical protein